MQPKYINILDGQLTGIYRLIFVEIYFRLLHLIWESKNSKWTTVFNSGLQELEFLAFSNSAVLMYVLSRAKLTPLLICFPALAIASNNLWMLTMGARLGRPWAHWNGNWHSFSWLNKRVQSSRERGSPNLMAPEL